MNVDRFERDKAQDGFVQRTIDDTVIRFRVSILPLASAATDIRSESIVIRVLDDRKVIEKAKGLLMRSRALSEEDAHAFLRRAAMNEKKKIVDVANLVIEADKVGL